MQRTRLAAIGAGDHRSNSLHVSIEVSLSSSRLGAAGRRLFTMLARLPDGLARADTRALLGDDELDAVTSLLKVGLARLDDQRLRMLAPVREHATQQTLADVDVAALTAHFGALADVLPTEGEKPADLVATRRACDELANIGAALSIPNESADVTVQGRRWLRIGDTHRELGSTELARRAYFAANIAFDSSSNTDNNQMRQQDLGISLSRLGEIDLIQGKLKEAKRNFEASLEIAKDLVKIDPGRLEYIFGLSVCLEKLGDINVKNEKDDIAIIFYRMSLRQREIAVINTDDQRWIRALSVSLNKIGNILLSKKEYQNALWMYLKSRRLAKNLVFSDPENKIWRRDLAICWTKISQLREMQGDICWAQYACNKSIIIIGELHESWPDDAELKRDLAIAVGKMGDMFMHLEDFYSAYDAYGECLERTIMMAAEDIYNAQLKRDMAITMSRLSIASYNIHEKRAESVGYIAEAINIIKNLKKDNMLAPKDHVLFDDFEEILNLSQTQTSK